MEDCSSRDCPQTSTICDSEASIPDKNYNISQESGISGILPGGGEVQRGHPNPGGDQADGNSGKIQLVYYNQYTKLFRKQRFRNKSYNNRWNKIQFCNFRNWLHFLIIVRYSYEAVIGNFPEGGTISDFVIIDDREVPDGYHLLFQITGDPKYHHPRIRTSLETKFKLKESAVITDWSETFLQMVKHSKTVVCSTNWNALAFAHLSLDTSASLPIPVEIHPIVDQLIRDIIFKGGLKRLNTNFLATKYNITNFDEVVKSTWLYMSVDDKARMYYHRFLVFDVFDEFAILLDDCGIIPENFNYMFFQWIMNKERRVLVLQCLTNLKNRFLALFKHLFTCSPAISIEWCTEIVLCDIYDNPTMVLPHICITDEYVVANREMLLYKFTGDCEAVGENSLLACVDIPSLQTMEGYLSKVFTEFSSGFTHYLDR